MKEIPLSKIGRQERIFEKIVQNWEPCKTFAIFDEARGEQQDDTKQSFLYRHNCQYYTKQIP